MSPVGRRYTQAIPERVSRMIAAYCAERRLSPFAVLFMALQTYLARVLGQESPCVGVPVIGRRTYDEKRAVGMYVSTLPFACDIPLSSSADEFQTALLSEWYELLKHQRAPYQHIVKTAREAGAGGALFSVALSYQNARIQESADARVSFEGRWQYAGYQAQPLCLHLSDREGEGRFLADYDYLTQVYSQRDMERMHRYIVSILRGALSRPDLPLERVPLLSCDEEDRVLYSVNHTRTRFPDEGDCGRWLARVCARHERRAAIISGGKRTTYRTLLEGARKLASGIKTRTERGEVVALMLPRDETLLIALAAVLFSGRAFMLIERATPEERVRKTLRQAGAKLLICEESTASRYADAQTPDSLSLSEGEYAESAAADALCYVACTSGTTGAPKAVAVSHASLMNFAHAMRPLYAQGAVLSACGTAFDAFLIESICALLNAQTVVLASERDMNDPSALAALITGYACGFLSLTPSRWLAYLQNADFSAALCRLEIALCGGERFPAGLEKRLRTHTEARILNQYGPTETCVGMAVKELAGDGALTVGKPMANCRAYVLDAGLAPVPVGAPGELYIGGVCVATGYLSDEGETARKFLPDPFAPGGRMYKSGDIARWTEMGELEIVGRVDRQLKIRGLRVEPGEVESRLCEHPQVAACAAAMREGRLLAWYTGDCAPEEALAFLRAGLPEYMTPARVVHVSDLPLSASGKIDYDRLPEIKAEEPVNEYPQSDAEARLLAIFRKHLGTEALSVTADFFASGGDSLSALAMLSEAGEAFGRAVDPQALREHASARALAALLSGDARMNAEEKYPRADDAEDYPLTPQQESFFASYLQNPESLAYNMPGAYDISGTLSNERLQSVLQKLVALEETLRTSFTLTPRGARAKIAERAAFTLETVHAPDADAAFKTFVRPFDLASPPLFRAARWQNTLLLDMHHIISDGLSGALLMARVSALYVGDTPAMPRVRYRDVAAARERRDPTQDRAYWREQLAGAPDFVDFPCDRQRPAAFDARGGVIREFLPSADTKALRAMCAERGVTPFMVLFAAFAALVYKLSAQSDMVIGTPVSLRDDASIQNVAGLLISPAPLRVRASGDMPYSALLSQVQKSTLAMLDHRALPLSEILSISGAPRASDRNPLYNLMFSYLPMDGAEFSLGEARLTVRPTDPGISKLDLTMEVSVRSEEMMLRLEYAKSLFSDDTAGMLARGYVRLVSDILSAPDQKLSALQATAARDYVRLVERPRRRRTPFECAPIDLFIDRAALLEPDGIAVCWGDGEKVTFAQLKQRSDALAARLMAAGAKRGDRVGVLCRRTGELPLALIAVIKAGCAYVPLDPAYPPQRMAYMLEETHANLLLTSEEQPAPDGVSIKTVTIAYESDAPFMPPEGRRAEDELYVLYTSGSTGMPKGVAVTHQNAANLLCDVEGLLPENACILACANVIFDIFATESLLALALGRRVCVADEEEMRLPWKMAARMAACGVSALQLTPSRMQACLSDEAFRQVLAGVSLVMLAGEPFTAKLLDDVRAVTNARIVNIYGPTETTVFSGYADLTDAESVCIGEPVANSRFYVLSQDGDPLPPLARGELYIAGACVAKGYAGRDDLTRERFLPDRFVQGDRMYKSGDIVRQRADGNYVYLGRADSQVKIDGHRIEPEEIAALLLGSGLFREAAVVPIIHGGTPRALYAFAVADNGFSEDEALEYLAARLPAYMLPARVIAIDEMPRTASGKLDRAALSANAAGEGAKAPQALADAQGFADIWRDVLGHVPNESDSFFAQGGTSLGALTVLSRYYQIGLTFSLEDFYAHPTLGEQTRLLESGKPPAPKRVSAMPNETVPEAPPVRCKPGCVLLTGASGFLGAHILRELRSLGRRVICLEHNSAVSTPCEIVRGDITKEGLGMTREDYDALCARVTAVWHCAADVRHYVADKRALRAVNVDGTVNMIAFARAADADFHYISTTSVAGGARDFTERCLYVGQDIAGNAYVQSKLDAERAVCAAMREGLPAKIYRVGRLCARASDGVFQKTPDSNAFYQIIRGLLSLQCLPESMQDTPVEMTSVDLCARACVLLSARAGACFHIYNPRFIPLDAALRAVGEIRAVPDETFAELVRRRAAGSDAVRAVAEAYFGGDGLRGAAPDCRETERALADAAFTWQTPDAALLLSCFARQEVTI